MLAKTSVTGTCDVDEKAIDVDRGSSVVSSRRAYQQLLHSSVIWQLWGQEVRHRLPQSNALSSSGSRISFSTLSTWRCHLRRQSMRNCTGTRIWRMCSLRMAWKMSLKTLVLRAWSLITCSLPSPFITPMTSPLLN